jgi:TDG/mug DNA glycosylase family protein
LTVGFTREQLAAAAGRGVPDLVGPEVRLLLVGVNPGLWTAAAQAHFAKRGNRFYQALYRAGLSSRPIDAAEGMKPEDAEDLVSRGIAITNLVNRATARADQLSDEELRQGARELAEKVERLQPTVVVILGLTAYRIGFDRPGATLGWQAEGMGSAALLVVGNPSGLNAHQTVGSLAEWFAAAGRRAGLEPGAG